MELSILKQTLSLKERKHAISITDSARRKEYVIGHVLLQQCLYLHKNILHPYYSNSKQSIKKLNTSISPYKTCLSHTKEIVGIGVHKKKIGFDLEPLEQRKNSFLQIAQRYFAASEYIWLKQLPEDLKYKGFILLWVTKEALVKYYNQNLQETLNKPIYHISNNTFSIHLSHVKKKHLIAYYGIIGNSLCALITDTDSRIQALPIYTCNLQNLQSRFSQQKIQHNKQYYIEEEKNYPIEKLNHILSTMKT